MWNIIKQNFFSNLKNIPGWQTDRKVVIIECDDWGGIRMPSKEVYTSLTVKGLKITGWFNEYDTLETEKDLEQLFDVLCSVKDKDNKSAVMTPVTCVANPDFDRIKSCGFSEYHFEPFTETLKKYYPGADVFKLWQEGMTARIFVPEFHGREHITVHFWMEKLREGNKDLLFAFDNGFVFLDVPGVPVHAKEFGAEFYFTSDNQKQFLINSIKEGVALFEDIFNCSPRVFVPSNGIFHPEFDGVLAESGIQFLCVNYSMPYPANSGKLQYRHFITGKVGPGGIIYYTRNCAFEPASPGYKGIEPTMSQIASAFRWGKPANISTHRVNFVGGIEEANRQRGLIEMKKLLKAIVRRWPDAEFMNSGDALEFMKNTN